MTSLLSLYHIEESLIWPDADPNICQRADSYVISAKSQNTKDPSKFH